MTVNYEAMNEVANTVARLALTNPRGTWPTADEVKAELRAMRLRPSYDGGRNANEVTAENEV